MNGLRNGGFDRSGYPSGSRRQRPLGRQRLVRCRPGWLLLVSLLLAQPGHLAGAEGGVYTWKDASGRVHYSNRRPEGQPAEAVELNAKPVTVRPTERIYTSVSYTHLDVYKRQALLRSCSACKSRDAT